MKRTIARQRYFVVASVMYVLLGILILVRAAIAHTVVIAIFGLVLVGLGTVRLRDYLQWRDRPR